MKKIAKKDLAKNKSFVEIRKGKYGRVGSKKHSAKNGDKKEK